MYVNTENKGTLNMRAEPSTSGKVLARIPYGTELTLSPHNEIWGKTTYNDLDGYVMLKFLSTNNPRAITKEDLQSIYVSLKECLSLIESVLK